MTMTTTKTTTTTTDNADNHGGMEIDNSDNNTTTAILPKHSCPAWQGGGLWAKALESWRPSPPQRSCPPSMLTPDHPEKVHFLQFSTKD